MADETPGLEISEPLATKASVKTSTTPIGAPVEPIQAPVAPTKESTESSKTSDVTKLKTQRNLVMIMVRTTQLPSQPPGNLQLPSPYFSILTFVAISCYSGRLGSS